MGAEIRPRVVEARGSTVEAAIEAGLARLGLIRNEVDIEILDEGSRGILGIGSRDAIVRLTPRMTTITPPPATTPPATTPSPPSQPATPTRPTLPEGATLSEEEAVPLVEARHEEALPFPQAATPQPPATALDADDVAPLDAPPSLDAPPLDAPSLDEDAQVEADEDSAAYLEQERDAAVLILTELLNKMKIRATVTTRLSEADAISGRRVNMLDVSGDDLGVLIGPRGDTLDALQYVARLMVAHRLHRRANFLVDVEGYRERREQALVRLAERMADKVRQRQEPISLEPMPPYERRVIHMTLRNASGVYTESTGEGDRRKVRIYPEQ